MFKYIIASFLFVSSALAFEYEPYVKFGGGLNQISPVHIRTTESTGKIKLSHKFPLIEIGAGLQLTDTIRTELVYDHYFLFLSKEESKNIYGDEFSVDYKTKINTLTVNTYKDIIVFNNITPFIGGGIGISFLQDSASGYGTNEFSTEKLENSFSKRTNRLTYKLTTGVAIKLTDSYHLDIVYNYINLGTNKPKLNNGITNVTKRDYLVHNLTTSLRFNF